MYVHRAPEFEYGAERVGPQSADGVDALPAQLWEKLDARSSKPSQNLPFRPRHKPQHRSPGVFVG